MGQTCQRTPSIMKTMIRKTISLPLLKKNDRLLTRQIEEEEFWKQFDRREQIIRLINEIDNAIAEDSQTINITYVSNFRLKGRRLKDWKSYPPNQIILRDRKLWRLNIFGYIKTKDDITTNNMMNDDTTICYLWHDDKWWTMNDGWRMISDKTETGGTYGKEPRTPDETSGPSTWHKFKILDPLIYDSTLIYWHTHHRQDQPTLNVTSLGSLC